MNVSETDIVNYITANPGSYSCTLDGEPHQICVSQDQALQVVNVLGYFRMLSTGHPEFVLETSRTNTKCKVVFEEALISKIKEAILKEQIVYELKALLPAAKAMVSHYEVVGAHEGFSPSAYIRMYWLKHIDFAQSGKGCVLIVPNGRGLEDSGNFIKGYIYHDDHASIKFESVQAWRYQAITRVEALNDDVPGLEDWLELLRER